MGTDLIGYFDAEQRSFDELSLHDADLFVFMVIVYAEFENMADWGAGEAHTLSELASLPDGRICAAVDNLLARDEVLALLQAVAVSRRFGPVEPTRFEARLQESLAMQYAADRRCVNIL